MGKKSLARKEEFSLLFSVFKMQHLPHLMSNNSSNEKGFFH
jgi:hypothetical protein